MHNSLNESMHYDKKLFEEVLVVNVKENMS